MTTKSITPPRLDRLTNMNPIMIYDGIMEMIFQEEQKSSEKVVKQKSMFAMMAKRFRNFLRINK